jgi:hypothetical protein
MEVSQRPQRSRDNGDLTSRSLFRFAITSSPFAFTLSHLTLRLALRSPFAESHDTRTSKLRRQRDDVIFTTRLRLRKRLSKIYLHSAARTPRPSLRYRPSAPPRRTRRPHQKKKRRRGLPRLRPSARPDLSPYQRLRPPPSHRPALCLCQPQMAA